MGKTSSDYGPATIENSILHTIETVLVRHDTGTGTDASKMTASLWGSDSGSALDIIIARLIQAAEPPTGALEFSSLLVNLSQSDIGTGAETGRTSYEQKTGDTGKGVDTSNILAAIHSEDMGSVIEAVTLVAAITAVQTGVGIENVLGYFRQVFETGTASEQITILGAVGRALKLRTYMRPYHQLRTYTQPYHKLRVYTKEVRE